MEMEGTFNTKNAIRSSTCIKEINGGSREKVLGLTPPSYWEICNLTKMANNVLASPLFVWSLGWHPPFPWKEDVLTNRKRF